MRFTHFVSGMNHHTSWLHSETERSEWLNPRVLLLSVSFVSWPVESSRAWPWSDAALLDWCSPTLLVRFTHVCVSVPGSLARSAWQWKKKKKNLLSASVKTAWAVKPDLRGPSSGAEILRWLTVRTRCAGRDGGEPSCKLRRSHCY